MMINDLIAYQKYLKGEKINILKSLKIRDLRINSILEDDFYYQESIIIIDSFINKIEVMEKEVDGLLYFYSGKNNNTDSELLIVKDKVEKFALLLNDAVPYIKYINKQIENS